MKATCFIAVAAIITTVYGMRTADVSRDIPTIRNMSDVKWSGFSDRKNRFLNCEPVGNF